MYFVTDRNLTDKRSAAEAVFLRFGTSLGLPRFSVCPAWLAAERWPPGRHYSCITLAQPPSGSPRLRGGIADASKSRNPRLQTPSRSPRPVSSLLFYAPICWDQAGGTSWL